VQFLRIVALYLWICLQLTACADDTAPAPVIDINDYPSKQSSIRPVAASSLQANVPLKPIPLLAPSFTHPSYQRTEQWLWPAEGQLVNKFSVTSKGIDIAGKEGSPVYASAAGRVVYSGNGLRGYGNLVIIKHNSLYLSAYAHNRHLLVKEGQVVVRGQKIAEMGHTGLGKTILHFEIRRDSRPVDPLTLLTTMAP
jgi:lipoprotein NlpD